MMAMVKVGRHVSGAGGLSYSIGRAVELGADTIQVFVTNPRTWAMSPVDKKEAGLFLKRASEEKVGPLFAHMPYLPNLASPDDSIWKKSIASLKDNVLRCEELGMDYLVTHLGSGKGRLNLDESLSRVVAALDSVAKYCDKTEILLENQAGHANSIGADLSDLTRIYEKSALGNSGKLGFCIDTCHAFEAGYDIRRKEGLDKMADDIDLKRVRAMHVNDAKFEMGERRDRHDNIGQGHIGIDGFKALLSYKNVSSKPLIMETPECKNITWKDEITLIRKLASD